MVQFDGKWVQQAAALVPEMVEVGPLLEQSARGIEFLGSTAESAAAAIEAMGSTTGLARLHSNLSNFNRHFLNEAGETPRHYRQRTQG